MQLVAKNKNLNAQIVYVDEKTLLLIVASFIFACSKDEVFR